MAIIDEYILGSEDQKRQPRCRSNYYNKETQVITHFHLLSSLFASVKYSHERQGESFVTRQLSMLLILAACV